MQREEKKSEPLDVARPRMINGNLSCFLFRNHALKNHL